MEIHDRKERAIEAFWILNDFIGDLITGIRAFEYFDTPKFKAGSTPEVLRRYSKMADCFIYITLAKWAEFYDSYRVVIPPNLLDKCKFLRKDLKQRGVLEFRNKVVGHIWSKKHNRPLSSSEIKKLETRITQGDVKSFLRWINDPENNRFGETVVGTSEVVRDEIKKTWLISQEELIRQIQR